MLGAKTIGCINHPGVEAIGRCRQCSKPVCKQCGIVAPTGLYCSQPCQDKHVQFLQRAKTLDLDKKYDPGFFWRLKNWIGITITLIALAVILGIVATQTYIPVLTEVTREIRSVLGL